MSKIVLNNVTNLTDSTTAANTINANSAVVQGAFDNTLSRDGTQPNTMGSVLDMNSNQIVNLPAPATANSPARLADVAAASGGSIISNIPVGGTTGQALVKNSNASYDTTWGGVTLTGDVTAPGGASTVTTIPVNTITNAKTAQMAANTFKGNPTGSTANATDFTIDGLPLKVSTVGADELILWDSVGLAVKKTTVSAVSSVGAVSSVNGQTGAIVNYYRPQGRLTLTTATPVMSSPVSAGSTVYYTPYQGNMVPIYDGTNMVPTPVAEVSQLTTDTTKSPSAVVASKVYDIFVWNDGGTIRATRGPAWTNNTTRGYTFTMVNGILLNTSSITNGPAASRGTWVGTIFSNATATVDYIFGTAASGGGAASLGVWNTYNRVSVAASVVDSGASYTYSSATVRQARASAGNQVTFVLGAQEDAVQFSYAQRSVTVAVSLAATNIGVGFNSTTAFAVPPGVAQTVAAASITGGSTNSGVWAAPLGVNTLAALESSDGANANNFDFSSTNTLMAYLRL